MIAPSSSANMIPAWIRNFFMGAATGYIMCLIVSNLTNSIEKSEINDEVFGDEKDNLVEEEEGEEYNVSDRLILIYDDL